MDLDGTFDVNNDFTDKSCTSKISVVRQGSLFVPTPLSKSQKRKEEKQKLRKCSKKLSAYGIYGEDWAIIFETIKTVDPHLTFDELVG
jgi:hypothetical protein